MDSMAGMSLFHKPNLPQYSTVRGVIIIIILNAEIKLIIIFLGQNKIVTSGVVIRSQAPSFHIDLNNEIPGLGAGSGEG